MAQVQGHPITPCLKEAMVYLSQSELYTQAPHLLELLTGQVQRQATFWGLAQDCGSALEALLQEVPQQPLEADSVVYCMADGSLLFTDDGWQEVKLGRLFIESTGRQQPLSRPFIEKSQYVAHLGQHQDFARWLDSGVGPLGSRPSLYERWGHLAQALLAATPAQGHFDFGLLARSRKAGRASSAVNRPLSFGSNNRKNCSKKAI